MVININPNRINSPAGGKTADRRRLSQPSADDAYSAPTRADVNYIPEPESLMTLISGAVSALRRGVYWDRGTILNLLA